MPWPARTERCYLKRRVGHDGHNEAAHQRRFVQQNSTGCLGKHRVCDCSSIRVHAHALELRSLVDPRSRPAARLRSIFAYRWRGTCVLMPGSSRSWRAVSMGTARQAVGTCSCRRAELGRCRRCGRRRRASGNHSRLGRMAVEFICCNVSISGCRQCPTCTHDRHR